MNLKNLLPKQGVVSVCQQYFVACLIAVISCVLSINQFLQVEISETYYQAITFLTCAYVWSVSAQIINRNIERKIIQISLYILPFGALYYLCFLNSGWRFDAAVLIPALLLFLSISPVLLNKNDQIFWRFNCQLWVGIIFAVITAGLIEILIFLAVLAVDALFDTDLIEKAGTYVTSVVVFIIAPLLALIHIPSKEQVNDFSTDPAQDGFVNKVVSWMLIPIILLYLAILYVYFARIIISQEVPNGSLALMIVGFAGVGVVTYLLVWPNQSRLAALYKKSFFKLLVIPIGFLIYAIWERIDAYGMTEARYIIALTSVWLALISLKNIFLRLQLRIIPGALAFMLLLSILGPWSAKNVTIKSQQNRLLNLLEEHQLVQNGKIIPAENEQVIPFKTGLRIYNLIENLCENYDQALPALFKRKDDQPIVCSSSEGYTHELGLKLSDGDVRNGIFSVNLNYQQNTSQDLPSIIYKEYEYFKTNDYVSSYNPCLQVACIEEHAGVYVRLEKESSILLVMLKDEVEIQYDLEEWLHTAEDSKSFQIPVENEKIKALINIKHINAKQQGLYDEEDITYIQSLGYDLFYTIKKDHKNNHEE